MNRRFQNAIMDSIRPRSAHTSTRPMQKSPARSPAQRTTGAVRSAHQRILAAKKDGQWRDTLNIIAEMRNSGHSLGTVSYNAAIDACGKAKQCGKALELFDEMVTAGNVPDQVTYTALIDACGRAGMLDQAFALFARCATRLGLRSCTAGLLLTAVPFARAQDAKRERGAEPDHLQRSHPRLRPGTRRLTLRPSAISRFWWKESS